jgi:hypothetical protein
VVLRLNSLGPQVAVLLFVVNIYTQNCVFRDVDNEFCRLVDTRSGGELVRFEMDYMDDKAEGLDPHHSSLTLAVLPQVDSSNNLLMCKLFKGPAGKWEMQALGLGMNGPRTAKELTQTIGLDPMTQEYQLNKPCCSRIPVDANVRKKPANRRRKGPAGGCACTIQ